MLRSQSIRNARVRFFAFFSFLQSSPLVPSCGSLPPGYPSSSPYQPPNHDFPDHAHGYMGGLESHRDPDCEQWVSSVPQRLQRGPGLPDLVSDLHQLLTSCSGSDRSQWVPILIPSCNLKWPYFSCSYPFILNSAQGWHRFALITLIFSWH